MFYTVFSTNDSPYMQWQSDLLEFSWKRVGQEGVLVRLVSTDDPSNLPKQKYAHTFATKLWDVHPETGDEWPIYNKPSSLLEWVFRDRPEGTVLLLDPDCVFRKPITRRVSPGNPVGQKWIDLKLDRPSKKKPFGLDEEFSFLSDHCAKTNLKADDVMIPTLIHTRDLRRICARWLELCGVIRKNYSPAQSGKEWMSDMFAYVVVCAEYGLCHDQMSLGICTNWKPVDAPAAPVIHYCQPILDRNGNEVFGKHFYVPGNHVESGIETEYDYGGDLIEIVNAFVNESLGVSTPPTIHDRPRKVSGIMEGRIIDELLLEVPADGRKIWLNSSGKAIWSLCNGASTIEQIIFDLEKQYEVDDLDLSADVLAAIGQLKENGFLELS